ncbi:MAG: methyltransferase, TIGR04325 family [Turneriella sp.]
MKSTAQPFFGNYASWEDARRDCNGYDAPAILEKVKESLLKVKNGEAAYERDSVIFHKIEYSMPLLVFLLYSASFSGGELRIVDFGGSLGSTYYQNRKFLKGLKKVKWQIIEQDHFVACGEDFFADEVLSFHLSIEDCRRKSSPNTILLSSVLPYLPKPYDILRQIKESGFEFIIIDRTPFFMDNSDDSVVIHKVPSEIYPAEIPTWFLNLKKIKNFLNSDYELIEEFEAIDRLNTGSLKVEYRALMFQRKNTYDSQIISKK